MRNIVRLCALIVLLCASGCTHDPDKGPPRPNSTLSVGLDISSTAKAGYLSTTASNGQVYYYLYSGDARPDGELTVAASRRATRIDFRLTSDGSKPFAFGGIFFPEDPHGQFERVKIEPASASFVDTNSARQDGFYEIAVVYKDGNGYVSLAPDPRIINN